MLIHGDDIIKKGKIQDTAVLENLTDPYVFIQETDTTKLALVVNILAKEKGYRVVSHAVDTAWT